MDSYVWVIFCVERSSRLACAGAHVCVVRVVPVVLHASPTSVLVKSNAQACAMLPVVSMLPRPRRPESNPPGLAARHRQQGAMAPDPRPFPHTASMFAADTPPHDPPQHPAHLPGHAPRRVRLWYMMADRNVCVVSVG